MQSSLQSLFVTLGHSALGHYMQRSVWGFAVVEALHLLALAALGGSLLIVDLRLLGVILHKESARLLSRDLSRILLSSLVVMIVTGVAMVSEEALKCYFSPAFRLKMALFAVAVLFHFMLHRLALLRADANGLTASSRIAAILSMILRLGVGVAGMNKDSGGQLGTDWEDREVNQRPLFPKLILIRP